MVFHIMSLLCLYPKSKDSSNAIRWLYIWQYRSKKIQIKTVYAACVFLWIAKRHMVCIVIKYRTTLMFFKIINTFLRKWNEKNLFENKKMHSGFIDVASMLMKKIHRVNIYYCKPLMKLIFNKMICRTSPENNYVIIYVVGFQGDVVYPEKKYRCRIYFIA